MALFFVDNQENQNFNKNFVSSGRGPWWRPAVQIFSEVSVWIAVPVVLAVVGGKALDNHYGTKPLFLLVSAGFAFILSAFGIIRTVRKYTDRMKRDLKNK